MGDGWINLEDRLLCFIYLIIGYFGNSMFGNIFDLDSNLDIILGLGHCLGGLNSSCF